MALTEQDREWVQLTARELVYQVSKGIVENHIKTCPVNQTIAKGKWMLAGAAIFGGLAFNGGWAVIEKIISIMK